MTPKRTGAQKKHNWVISTLPNKATALKIK